jgi:hypothetical protein
LHQEVSGRHARDGVSLARRRLVCCLARAAA